MRQIAEKAYGYNIQIDILFVDFKQAFDSINIRRMIIILHLQGILSKLTRLIRMTLEDSQARVVIENNLTEIFNVNV